VVRQKLLKFLCIVCRMQYPNSTDVVGIATSPLDSAGMSEDLVYLDGSHWTAEDDAEARELQTKWGLLTNIRQTEIHESEYPRTDAIGVSSVRAGAGGGLGSVIARWVARAAALWVGFRDQWRTRRH